uniref:Uncharacterized protein n=1 Tax=Arundo donax TaxID=35708 RepID=A0A0A9E419_ARUDO
MKGRSSQLATSCTAKLFVWFRFWSSSQ